MKAVFKVDGVAYNVLVEPGALRRKASILDGENAGRAKSGRMIRDIIGTYYNYSLTLDTRGMDVTSYDSLFEALSAPVDSHTIEMPYGQGTLAFEAYVSNVNDQMEDASGRHTVWGGMTVTFTSMAPQRIPG